MNSFLFYYNFQPCLIAQDVKYIWNYIKEAVHHAIKLYVPSIQLKSQQQQQLKWFTPNIRHNLHCLHTLRRFYHRAPSPVIKTNLEDTEERLQHLIEEAKSHYETKLIEQFAHSTALEYFNISLH